MFSARTRPRPADRRTRFLTAPRPLCVRVAGLLGALAVALASGCGGEETREGAPRGAPATGRHVDVGGYRIYVQCAGEGAPPVVIESGAGLDSSDWTHVQRPASRFARVCAYDRAGLGKSDHAPDAEASDADVPDALHALLERAGIAPPYVLVGHSMGGLYIRMYAAEHPDEVAGMVLVDSVSGERVSLGVKPLVVLAAANGSVGDQGAFARVSENSVLVVAKESGHYIERDQPKLVVEAIRQVVAAARDGSALPACGEPFERLGGECAA